MPSATYCHLLQDFRASAIYHTWHPVLFYRRVVTGKTEHTVYKMNYLNMLWTFLALLLYISCIDCYFVNIDAHAEECFFDKVKSGTKMSLMFEVAEGGFLDIDVKV